MAVKKEVAFQWIDVCIDLCSLPLHRRLLVSIQKLWKENDVVKTVETWY